MKAIFTALTLAAMCYTGSAAISVVGGPLYNPANGHSYYLLTAARWDEAELYSQSLGGHLVTLNNAAENNWVYDNMISGHPDLNPWIGLNDIGSPGVWHWASGETATYLNFAPGEPNGVGLPPYGANIFPSNPYPTFAGQWNDVPISDVIQGIAEVPEPSVLALGLCAFGAAVLRRRR
jgi:hypothetical protein